MTLEGAFVSAIEDTTEGSSEGTPEVAPWDLYTDTQEGAIEVEIKGAVEVKIELHFWRCAWWCTCQGTGVHKTIQ